MSGILQINVTERAAGEGGNVHAPRQRHVQATAYYDTEEGCRSALNDVIEMYAVGREVFWRSPSKPEPREDKDYRTGVTQWAGHVNFSALFRPGKWHEREEQEEPLLRYL